MDLTRPMKTHGIDRDTSPRIRTIQIHDANMPEPQAEASIRDGWLDMGVTGGLWRGRHVVRERVSQ